VSFDFFSAADNEKLKHSRMVDAKYNDRRGLIFSLSEWKSRVADTQTLRKREKGHLFFDSLGKTILL
jgi:hypothetical protein